jgi:hypothetical protein
VHPSGVTNREHFGESGKSGIIWKISLLLFLLQVDIDVPKKKAVSFNPIDLALRDRSIQGRR